MALIKSKQRVADHGEVFTPPWMVDAMLDLVNGETELSPMARQNEREFVALQSAVVVGESHAAVKLWVPG